MPKKIDQKPKTKKPETKKTELKRPGKLESLADSGIDTCLYEPQEAKLSLPGYESSQTATASISVSTPTVGHSAVVVADFTPEMGWEALQKLLSYNQDQQKTDQLLDSLIEAIGEQGSRMWPLLLRLKEAGRDDALLNGLAKRLEDKIGSGPPTIPKLAPREREVIAKAASGLSNAEIAKDLNLQVITVGKTLTRTYRKLGAKNRSEAIRNWLLISG
ncbi:MAG: helix-turn-helix transcriptional regulator [Deltaproteobacteria bacterium]|jgi:DNA-binding NarL/FixJ family response regulator|nr:helix-turn-helix transcriptional regulator [Deltaproteobacteria bacterium]